MLFNVFKIHYVIQRLYETLRYVSCLKYSLLFNMLMSSLSNVFIKHYVFKHVCDTIPYLK